MAQTAATAPPRAPATSTATIRILRFNSESDAEPTYRSYQVQVEPTDRVLDALNMIKWYQDGSLTYRRSCAHGVCGSDAMRINGVNRLACKVLMRDVGKDVVIEPLMGFRVIKDLVVDMEPFFAQYRSVFPYLINDERPPERERRQSIEDREIFDDTTKCILCAACTTSCPSFWANEEFVGPAALAKAYRFVGDPRDGQEGERLKDLAEDPHGMYDCTHCFACVEVCPKDVAPMNQIMRLRRRATSDHEIKDRNNGYGHEKAFVNLIEKYGTLHEAQLLPRSFGDGSLIKGQIEPTAVKQLIQSLPTAVGGLKSGKVSPVKALWHHKLPGQENVKRIFEEIESKDERLELNLYIVEEEPGEEQGAMAEGSQES